MHQITFYVPESHLERVKNALFKVGAGQFANYDQVCWQTIGTGQFRPTEGATPHSGEKGKLSTIKEYKVEMICKDDKLEQAIDQLIQHHPYETPAYTAIAIKTNFPFST